MSTPKPVYKLVKGNSLHWVGDGFPVYNLLECEGLGKHLNPFIMLDYAAPYKFKPSRRSQGVGLHPHRGFETVTFAFQGEITHTDSTGKSDTIYAGDCQWMTAGRGIEHSEMHSDEFSKNGGTFEVLQLWVNLPSKKKLTKPKYQAITAGKIPTVSIDTGSIDIVAGEYAGQKGPARTFTPMSLLIITLNSNTTTSFEFPEGWVAAVLVRNGFICVNGQPAGSKDLVALGTEGASIQLVAKSTCQVILMAGEPITEPIACEGPMVMNTQKEVVKAIADYRAGKFK